MAEKKTTRGTARQADKAVADARKQGRLITTGRAVNAAEVAKKTSAASNKATGRNTSWAVDDVGTYAVWYDR